MDFIKLFELVYFWGYGIGGVRNRGARTYDLVITNQLGP